ncbi:hypothetical protein DRN63_03585 [Nanoarchaeota archaeon]|nr:MAG: hypothetical protein DRN63_03585 [Nanoarchaeota archaeon]
MNIFIVPPNDLINNVLPNRLYHLARSWEQHHKLYLLRYPRYPTSTNVERVLKRIDIVPRAKPSSDPSIYYIKNAKSIYEAIEKALKREPIDVVIHANILPSLFVIKLAKKLETKIIFDYLDHYPESASAYYKNKLMKSLVHTVVFTITKYNLRNSDDIVAVSYALKQTVEKYAKKTVYLIPNGVDVQLFKPLPKDYVRRRLALEFHEPILLYYGSITEWIDYNALLKVTAKLKPEYPNILLLLVGIIYKNSEEMELRQKIRRLDIEKNVVLYPPQPHERIPMYVSASDIVIAPYRNLPKNFVTPVKILEALACEKPVITSDLFEFRLWFKDYLEYYRTVEELEEKVLSILKMRDLLMEKLRIARRYIEENFHWKRLAEKYEHVLYSNRY